MPLAVCAAKSASRDLTSIRRVQAGTGVAHLMIMYNRVVDCDGQAELPCRQAADPPRQYLYEAQVPTLHSKRALTHRCRHAMKRSGCANEARGRQAKAWLTAAAGRNKAPGTSEAPPKAPRAETAAGRAA